MKYISGLLLLGIGIAIGFLVNDNIKKEALIKQMEESIQPDLETKENTQNMEDEKPVLENEVQSMDRMRSLHSTDYTLLSDSSMPIQRQNDHSEWLVYHITKQGELGRAVVFQTKDEPIVFLKKMQGYDGEFISYVLTKNTLQGLSRKLFDGMAESQYFVTQKGDIYLYFFDTFTARGCSEEEVCINTDDVINRIGWK